MIWVMFNNQSYYCCDCMSQASTRRQINFRKIEMWTGWNEKIDIDPLNNIKIAV